MGITRDLILKASRSQWMAAQLRHRAFFQRAVKRFMPGEDLESALRATQDLAALKVGTVLTELGEQVTNRVEAEQVRDHYLMVLGEVRKRGLPAQVSIKLTHLGLESDPDACLANLRALCAKAAETENFVWVDMEESRYVDVTLGLFRKIRAERTNVGVCLQAYLHRTHADLESLLPLGPAIRLVKGAYNEPASVAFPSKRDVDAQYYTLAGTLLENVPRGARPVFGTHDIPLIARIQARAGSLGVSPKGYELHMLYGIRASEQKNLAAAGAAVRVLISYGSAWFAWYMRRLAERPANVWFVLRNIL